MKAWAPLCSGTRRGPRGHSAREADATAAEHAHPHAFPSGFRPSARAYAIVALLAVGAGCALAQCSRRGCGRPRPQCEAGAPLVVPQAVPVIVPMAVTWGAEADDGLPQAEVVAAVADETEAKRQKRRVRALISSVSQRLEFGQK